MSSLSGLPVTAMEADRVVVPITGNYPPFYYGPHFLVGPPSDLVAIDFLSLVPMHRRLHQDHRQQAEDATTANFIEFLNIIGPFSPQTAQSPVLPSDSEPQQLASLQPIEVYDIAVNVPMESLLLAKKSDGSGQDQLHFILHSTRSCLVSLGAQVKDILPGSGNDHAEERFQSVDTLSEFASFQVVKAQRNQQVQLDLPIPLATMPHSHSEDKPKDDPLPNGRRATSNSSLDPSAVNSVDAIDVVGLGSVDMGQIPYHTAPPVAQSTTRPRNAPQDQPPSVYDFCLIISYPSDAVDDDIQGHPGSLHDHVQLVILFNHQDGRIKVMKQLLRLDRVWYTLSDIYGMQGDTSPSPTTPMALQNPMHFSSETSTPPHASPVPFDEHVHDLVSPLSATSDVALLQRHSIMANATIVNIPSPMEAAEEIEDATECVICMSAMKSVILLPCRHLAMCNNCADIVRFQTKKCPICRQHFTTMLSIHERALKDITE